MSRLDKHNEGSLNLHRFKNAAYEVAAAKDATVTATTWATQWWQVGYIDPTRVRQVKPIYKLQHETSGETTYARLGFNNVTDGETAIVGSDTSATADWAWDYDFVEMPWLDLDPLPSEPSEIILQGQTTAGNGHVSLIGLAVR